MRTPMQMWKQAEHLLKIPSTNYFNMEVFNSWRKPRDKVVFILGATGTGKSRLSIDLATRFSAEIINSDKIQAYKGLDIVTNKVSKQEQCGIPHHLLSILQPNIDFTTKDFCVMATNAVESIIQKNKLPIIVGGSNRYIESLVTDPNYGFNSNYDCCFLWVDVSIPIIRDFVSHRVDQMVESGLVQEVREIFDPNNNDYTRGILRAIGVPELDNYFRVEHFLNESDRVQKLKVAINAIKDNTCVLADRQLEKIYRLRNVNGWDLNRIDATDVFRKMSNNKVEGDEAWDKLVKIPSYKIVGRFLRSRHGNFESNLCTKVVRSTISSNQAMMTTTNLESESQPA